MDIPRGIRGKDTAQKIILAALAGIVCGLFSFAWTGWWYVFDFIILSIIGYIFFEIIKGYRTHRHLSRQIFSELRNDVIIFVVLMVVTAISVSLAGSFSNFTAAFTAPLGATSSFKTAAHADLWPNVYTTVAELNSADIPTIVNQVAFGINLLFSLALLGIILTMVRRKPNAKEYWLIGFSAILFAILASSSVMSIPPMTYLFILIIPVVIAVLMLFTEKESAIDVKPAFMLTLWFVGMIYASIQGVRFILLLIPAFSIAVAVAIGYLYQYFSRIFNEGGNIPEWVSKLCVFIVLCLILIVPVQIGISTGKSYMPSMTKGWWDSLTKIREQSAPNAIINSWWDFGHWFKYVADRAVTLDGATQNSPDAHWLGLILQTNDENRSVGILRMLDCGSNNAFDEVNKKYNDTEQSENVVSELITLNDTAAQKYLSDLGYTSSEIATIMSYSHCSPPEDYFITSEDMVGKAGVWAHFGVWSFDKAFIVNNVRGKPLAEAIKIMKDRWNYTDDYATQTYYEAQALQSDSDMNAWIAPWPSYATQSMVPCSNVTPDVVMCSLGIGVGSNGQQNIVLESAAVNITAPETSQVLIGLYDKTTNAKVGENVGSWKEVVIADKEMKKYEMGNVTIGLSFLLDVEHSGNSTTYSAMVADPLLIDSTFTKLFFLNGKYMDHFEKFSDTTDITGARIIVWKVKW